MTDPDLTRRAFLSLLAGAATAAAPAPPVVRFRLDGGRMVLPVRIGDREHRFLLDSGAAMSGLDRRIAETLGLQRIGVRRMRGVAGRALLPAYLAATVTVGGVLQRPELTLLGYPAIATEGIDGLIGADLLTGFDSSLDFDRLEWRLWPRGSGPTEGLERLQSGVVADLQRGPRLLVDTLLDSKPCRLLVDTGAPRTLLFGPSAQRLGYWSDSRPYSPTVTPDIFGQQLGSSRLVRAGEMALGSIRFDGPQIALQDPKAPGRETLDGLLGLDLIQQIDWMVDVKGAAVWARRRPPRRAP